MEDKKFEFQAGKEQPSRDLDMDFVQRKYSFKLTKNTKGFNYEFKVNEDDLEVMKKTVIELNQWSIQNFGGA